MKIDFDGAVKALKEIIKIKSVEESPLPNAPFGKGVRACLDYSLDLMNGLGFSVKDIEGYCGYGETGEGELFGVLCHLDVVPEGNGWIFPPYEAVIDSGKLYGRGTLDDKGPFIACLYAAKALLDEGLKPKKRLRFILGCDEESGWKCMDRYFQTEETPAMGFSPDGDFPVINCEKGIVYSAITGELPESIISIKGGLRPNMVPAEASCEVAFDSGILKAAFDAGLTVSASSERIKLFSSGISAHGSHPEKGDNAIIKLLKVLGVKYSAIKQLADKLDSYDGKNVSLDWYDEKSGALTLNLGTAETIDGIIRFELDTRYPVTRERSEVVSTLQSELTLWEVKQGFYHDPLYISPDHPLVKTLLDAYKKVVPSDAKPIAIGGGTYARALPVGIAFGPCFPFTKSSIHEKDEFIDLDEFKMMAEIYYHALKELCF